MTAFVSGTLFASALALSACGGGSGVASSSLPAQPSQQQNPSQATPPPASASSGVRIYASNTFANTVVVFDEDGHPIANCPFPNLHQPFQIAFDSNKDRLDIRIASTTSPIKVYDLQGNPITTKGSFSGALDNIAFDSNNNRLYTLTGAPHQGSPELAVFDQEGNAIPINGNFFDNGQPMAMVFDPFNHHFYVADSNFGIFVFDEEGNTVSLTVDVATSTNAAKAFDTHNRVFYAGSAQPALGSPAVSAFDESGKAVLLSGTFPNAGAVSVLTFDANNNRLYEEDFGGGVHAYDEQGNQITFSGKFPGVLGNGLVAAPQ